MGESSAGAIDSELFFGTALAVLTLIAIIVGPILAVVVSRRGDDRRQKSAARLEVFRGLMRTRGVRMNTEHVWALNLIEVEFYGNEAISTAYREYIKSLNSPWPVQREEQERFFEQQNDLYADLLKVIGSSLGYEFDKRDLDRTGYAPQGWTNDEGLQRQNANLLNELLTGKRPLPIMHLAGSIDGPYPPPPSAKE